MSNQEENLSSNFPAFDPHAEGKKPPISKEIGQVPKGTSPPLPTKGEQEIGSAPTRPEPIELTEKKELSPPILPSNNPLEPRKPQPPLFTAWAPGASQEEAPSPDESSSGTTSQQKEEEQNEGEEQQEPFLSEDFSPLSSSNVMDQGTQKEEASPENDEQKETPPPLLASESQTSSFSAASAPSQAEILSQKLDPLSSPPKGEQETSEKAKQPPPLPESMAGTPHHEPQAEAEVKEQTSPPAVPFQPSTSVDPEPELSAKKTPEAPQPSQASDSKKQEAATPPLLESKIKVTKQGASPMPIRIKMRPRKKDESTSSPSPQKASQESESLEKGMSLELLETKKEPPSRVKPPPLEASLPVSQEEKGKNLKTPPPLPVEKKVTVKPSSPLPQTPELSADLKNKKPAPLLARKRYQEEKETSQLPASSPPISTSRSASIKREPAQKRPAPRTLEEAVKKNQTRFLPPWLQHFSRLGAYTLIIFSVLALGLGSYLLLSETRVQGIVAISPEEGWTVEEVALVRDFRGEIQVLAEDLTEVREPLLQEIQEREAILSETQADLAGREERLRLLQEEVQNAEQEIKQTLEEARQKAQKIWGGPGQDLDNQYDTHIQKIKQTIQERATQLGLDYKPNETFQSPEAWVNAFRLSLYDAPEGVKSTQEREWAETQIAKWRAYAENWQQKVATFKTQVEAIQAEPREKIAEINSRIQGLTKQIEATEFEISPIRQEFKENKKNLTDLEQEEAGLEEPKYQDLLRVSNHQVLKSIEVDSQTGVFQWRKIEKDIAFGPGEYLLWIRAKKNNEEFWGFVSFTIRKNQTTQLIIYPDVLFSIRKALRSAP